MNETKHKRGLNINETEHERGLNINELEHVEQFMIVMLRAFITARMDFSSNLICIKEENFILGLPANGLLDSLRNFIIT